MLIYVYLYEEELSCQIFGGRWRLIWDFAMLTTTRLVILNIPHSASFGHGYSMTSKTSLADVAWMYCTWTWLWMSFSPWHFWNLTTHLQHKSRWRMVAQSSCCHETFESEQLKYFKIWDRRKDWVKMHLIIRCTVGLCQSHIVPTRYKSCNACGDNPHWRRLSVWLWQSWLASNVDSTHSSLQLLLVVAFLLCSEGEFVQRKAAAHGRTSSGVMLQPVDGGINLKKICFKDFEGKVVVCICWSPCCF